jgi:hypothetical protein
MAHEPTLDKHHTHQIVIQPRFFKGRSYLVPALLCSDCNQWITWLRVNFAKELTEQYKVEWLEPCKKDRLKLLQQNLRYREQKKLELRGVV